MEVPRAEPLKEEELAGQPAGPRCAPAQRISCLSFLRKHPAPWLGGRRGRGDQQGNCFPALRREGRVSTAEKGGEVRLTLRYPRCPWWGPP